MAKEKEIYSVEYSFHIKGNSTYTCEMYSLFSKKRAALAFAESINLGAEDEGSGYHCFDAKVVPKTLQ